MFFKSLHLHYTLPKQPKVDILTWKQGCQVCKTKLADLLFKTSPVMFFCGFPLLQESTLSNNSVIQSVCHIFVQTNVKIGPNVWL